MTTLNFSDIIRQTLHAKRYRVKRYVTVKAKWNRDARGRFVSLARKAYRRRLLDRKAPMVSNMEMLAENVVANNALLSHLKKRGNLRPEGTTPA